MVIIPPTAAPAPLSEPLVVTADDVGDQVSALRRRSAWGIGVVALCGFVLALGYQAHQTDRTGDALRTTDRGIEARSQAVASTEERLARGRDALGEVSADLDRLEGRLAAATSELEARTSERDGLLGTLDGLAGELRGTEEALTATAVQLVGQVQEVNDLRACLDGVTRALTLVTFDDTRGALANLDRVAQQCARAEASIDLPGIGV
ncbi:MAG: hypothetical protein H0U89_09985 [Acidimicrobiia bacterium]|nr:hypothetical protein [Acidimicrobiia bacterium]